MARTPPARTAGQRPFIALVALVVLGLGTTELLALRTDGDATGDRPGVGQPAAPEPGRTAEVVGVTMGAALDEYVADRREALAAAPAAVDVAIVSFTQRLLLEDALVLLGDGVEVRTVLLQLPLETASPVAVPVGDDPVADVAEEVARQVEPLADEEEETRRLLEGGTVDDPEFEAEYQRRLDELVAARAAADGEVPLVHAVVVQGPVEQLLALVDVTAVRLVDPAPPGTDPRVSVFHGLLPEDQEVASSGRPADA